MVMKETNDITYYKKEAGNRLNIIGYSIGERKLFISDFTFVITLNLKGSFECSEICEEWLMKMILNIEEVTNGCIFIANPHKDFTIIDVETPKFNSYCISYKDGLRISLPDSWVIITKDVMATERNFAEWLKQYIVDTIDESFLNIDSFYMMIDLPNELNITIKTVDEQTTAETEISFNKKLLKKEQQKSI